MKTAKRYEWAVNFTRIFGMLIWAIALDRVASMQGFWQWPLLIGMFVWAGLCISLWVDTDFDDWSFKKGREDAKRDGWR